MKKGKEKIKNKKTKYERNGDYYFDNKKEGRNNAASCSYRLFSIYTHTQYYTHVNVRLSDSLCHDETMGRRDESWRPKIDDQ